MTTNTRSKLIMALISLVSVLAIGCGDTQEYVFTGTVPNANTGSVLFQLDRPVVAAQAATIPGTSFSVTVDFFYADSSPVPGFPKTVELGEGTAFDVLIENVPTNVASYVLTVTDAEGIPLVEFEDDIAVQPGVVNIVDLSVADETDVVLAEVTLTIAPTALNITASAAANTSATAQASVTTRYSNGQLLPVSLPLSNTSNRSVVFTSSADSVANVSATGLVTAVANGTANFVATVHSYDQNVSSNTVVVTVSE